MFTDNNLRAFVIGGVGALVLVVGPVLFKHKGKTDATSRWLRKETLFPAFGAFVVLAGLVVCARTGLQASLPTPTATRRLLMFLLAGIFVVATAHSSEGGLRVHVRVRRPHGRRVRRRHRR